MLSLNLRDPLKREKKVLEFDVLTQVARVIEQRHQIEQCSVP